MEQITGCRYAQHLQRTAAENEDMLVRYRASEMNRLVSEVGPIEAFDYELSLKVLDHIEVMPAGFLIFCSGAVFAR